MARTFHGTCADGQPLNLLIDPFIEHNPKYPKNFALPEAIHYILLTHAHMDHMQTLFRLQRNMG